LPNHNKDVKIVQYWGWAKYRYREEEKKNFEQAKAAAIKWLDACPPEVIRKFINRSWRFTSAYRLGLTGWAADWAVKKYRSHHTISEQALRALEAAGRLKGPR
jgi:hypothetical protein